MLEEDLTSSLERKKAISFRVTIEQYIRLMELSQRGGLPISAILRLMIHKELSENPGLKSLGYQGRNFHLHNKKTGRFMKR